MPAIASGEASLPSNCKLISPGRMFSSAKVTKLTISRIGTSCSSLRRRVRTPSLLPPCLGRPEPAEPQMGDAAQLGIGEGVVDVLVPQQHRQVLRELATEIAICLPARLRIDAVAAALQRRVDDRVVGMGPVRPALRVERGIDLPVRID